MVGLVIVSHSAALAGGVAELAREMGGEEIAVEVAGGLDEPDGGLGTDAVKVAAAIERADSGDGVLVLMDLGSAVLSAEMAVEMLTEGAGERVRLSPAPLVEGAVAASASARQGASLPEVSAEADRGIDMKAGHLEAEEGMPDAADAAEGPGEGGSGARLRLEITNPMGLHARPAARFVETAARFDAEISVVNATTGKGPASGTSLSDVATLGVRQGHEIVVRASGRDAEQALHALTDLALQGFGEAGSGAVPSPSGPDVVAAKLVDERAREIPRGPISGVAASTGVAIGPAHVARPPELEAADRVSGDPAGEWRRLLAAIDHVKGDLREVRSSVAGRLGEAEAAIFDAHALLVEDDALVSGARRMIFDDGVAAGQAYLAAAGVIAKRFEALEDGYQRARADDVHDVAGQVASRLAGHAPGPSSPQVPSILVADELTATDVARLDPHLVLGIATARGGATSHVAILARSEGIPAVVGVGNVTGLIEDGAELIVDGGGGKLHVSPDPETLESYRARVRVAEAADAEAHAAARDPAVTLDGIAIAVMANAGSARDARRALDSGAEGIGLLRTEFLFLDRASGPNEDEQVRIYEAVAAALGGRPVILRTLDAGADKPLPYLPQGVEANPFLGVRGVRLGLAHPDLLVAQLRAALRVAAVHPLKIMFPMVATIEEFRRLLALIERSIDELEAEGLEVRRPETGVMVEVPSVALQARRFAPLVDFFSIGTNDLTQYTMAAERGNERVAALGDALHPAVLRLVHLVCEAAEAHGKWVGVCGELAGDPLATAVLVGLGVRELSASAPAIARIKQAVRNIGAARSRSLALDALELEGASEVRELVRGPAEEGLDPGPC